MTDCYCGAEASFDDCCAPIINGEKTAVTAEQLMRARFSAYSTAAIDFLHDSLHPSGQENFDFEATKKWAENSEWLNLRVLSTKSGQANDKVGSVEFIATYKGQDGQEVQHAERSQFKNINSKWFFCDGQSIAPQKVGRNDPCNCGSGKKYKKCCGA